MSIFDDIKESITNFLSEFTTNYKESRLWKEYHLGLARTHCLTCYKRNNKIYMYSHSLSIPEHVGCKCFLTSMRALAIGEATNDGKQGVDCYIYKNLSLPSFYITKENARQIGWKPHLGNLDKVAPGKMIGGDVFYNREGKLPSAPGRVWYECDIDYNGGFRNNYRLIYSNDGFIFKTDSHYVNFISIE